MDNEIKRGINVPSKIMIGLAVCVLLGLGLCGTASVAHGDTLPAYLFGTGAFFFWGSLLLMIVFGIGWVIYVVVKGLIGKKDGN